MPTRGKWYEFSVQNQVLTGSLLVKACSRVWNRGFTEKWHWVSSSYQFLVHLREGMQLCSNWKGHVVITIPRCRKRTERTHDHCLTQASLHPGGLTFWRIVRRCSPPTNILLVSGLDFLTSLSSSASKLSSKCPADECHIPVDFSNGGQPLPNLLIMSSLGKLVH